MFKSRSRGAGVAASMALVLSAAACGGGRPASGRAAVPPPVVVPPPAVVPPSPPVAVVETSATAQRAAGLRAAADALEKAAAALAEGKKDSAEFNFSTAELVTGPAALADLAPLYREGAPPRVETPLVVVADSGPQPAAVGSSDEEDLEEEKVNPPPPPTPKDPPRGSLEGNVTVTGKVAAGTLAVVTLEPVSGKFKARKPKQRVVEQRDREFLPRLLVVATGSTVSFPNFDKIFHNVYSTAKAQPFDLGIYKEGASRDVTFNSEGVYRLGCNLHANMSAHIVVVSQPHYVIADSSGKFSFRSLAPGKYKMKIWTEKSTTPVTQEITIKAGKNTTSGSVEADAPEGPQATKFGTARAS